MMDGRGRDITKLGMIVSFVLGLLFSISGYWYLAVAAGLAGGSFFKRIQSGIWVNFIGVALSWMVNILGRPSDLLVQRVLETINIGGLPEWISVILVILIGGFLGALGGGIGSGIKRFKK